MTPGQREKNHGGFSTSFPLYTSEKEKNVSWENHVLSRSYIERLIRSPSLELSLSLITIWMFCCQPASQTDTLSRSLRYVDEPASAVHEDGRQKQE
jgi:hypothetical protein